MSDFQKNNNNTKVLKSGIWYTVANFLTRGLAILTTPLFTRLMTQQEYGAFNNYISWQSILLILATFDVQASLISARYDFQDDFDRYILSALALSSASVCAWALILNIFSTQVKALFAMSLRNINLMLLYILFIKAIDVFQMKQRYLYAYKLQVTLSLTLTFSTVLLSLLFVLNLQDRLLGRILGNVLPALVLGGMTYVYFWKRGKKIIPSYWKYTVKICLPYIPHLMSMVVLSSTDRIMINRLCSTQETALYSLAYNCGYMISILLNSMNTAYIPWLAEKIHENDFKSVRQFSKQYVVFFICIALGVMLAGPEALLILGGKSYLSAKYVMPPVTMGCICQFIYTMFVNVEQTKKKTVGMAFASVSAALLNYVLNLIFIPKFGYIAAAYTTLAGYLWLLAVHMFMVYRMKMAGLYSYRFIAGVVLTVGACTAGVNLLYGVTPVRYAVATLYLGGLLLIVYRNRAILARLLGKLRASKS